MSTIRAFRLLAVYLAVSIDTVHAFECSHLRKCRVESTKLFSDDCKNDELVEQQDFNNEHHYYSSVARRKSLLALTTSAVFASFPVPTANAGEVGARINKAVTTSDLGVSVRRSVVRGAQVFDQVDGKWEQFSDKFGLGAERSRRDGRPLPRDIPPLLPLDTLTAKQILESSEDVFLAASGITARNGLQDKIKQVSDLVRPSFERSGLDLSSSNDLSTAEQFNFASYVHFKAYADLVVENKVPFPTFKRDFEQQLGDKLVRLLYSDYRPTTKGDKKGALDATLADLDRLCTNMRGKGLVAATERSPLDEYKLLDYLDGLEDLQFNIALDMDATLKAQILLQEQGFRLVPAYGRFAVLSILTQARLLATIEDYYMDTDYNSDPNRFEVKQVLMNVVLESV